MGVSKARARLRSRWGRLDVEAAASAALFASSSVAVMAPALTEGGAQKPETLLSSLPAGGFLSAEQAAEVCQEREVLAKFVVSANVQPTKIDELCLEGVPKDVIRDVINSKYANGIENLPASGSDLIALLSAETAATTSNSQMMNDQSMAEQPDSMGFLKTSVDVPLAQEDKLSTSADVDAALGDVEQMMGGFDGVEEQNVEEILRVFKSMEETVSSGVPEESVPMGPPGSMFPIAEEGFASFEREFLNDVVIGLCQEANINDTAEQQRAQAIVQQQDQSALRQFQQERRCAFLLRRLRKLQAQLVGCHVAEENMGVLEVAHASAKKFFYQELQDMGSKSNVKNFPEISTNLNSFLHKIEKTSTAQSNSLNRQRTYCRYFGAGSRDNNLGAANRHQVFGTPKIKLNADELENVAGPLDTQLRTIHDNLDSDCTASSSGGESADEMQTFNNLHQQRLPISKRAAWRYAQDRASIASRWTWLQAQISDLEYKIRQQNDLQRQLRTTKGVVILDNAETVNGYSGVLPGSTIARYNSSSSTPEELPASRTRPFVWGIYRKRKLLQLDRLHEVSKRAAKASSIRCDCDRTLPACALCTGRTDPTQPQEPLEQMSLQERIAFVDPGYHPVLSFHDEILHSTHLDAIMKSVEWQQKMLRGNIRMTRIKDKESNERRNKKLPEHRTKYTSRLKKTSTNVITASLGIKRKVSKGKRNRLSQDRHPHGVSGSKKKIPKQPASVEDDEEASALSSSSKHSSPVPSPLQHTTASSEKNPLKEKISVIHGRSRQNSYDIDNIVIPYSVAASTRLEKLQYKEILTPKWRLCEELAKVDVKNGMHRPSQDSDYEDVSDETIALRHERSEREENKRFMTFANMPHHSRIRHNRRTDSRADSGANTPDPMSPHPSDFGGDVTSPITSPPATPLQAQDTDSQQSQNMDRSSSLFRRRTNSSVRTGKEEATSTCPNEDDKEIIPYEPRTFPLSEEVYDKMLEAMPDGHWQTSSASVCSREEDKVDDEAEMESHESDTTESAYCDAEGEDPNDPEWTVADDRDADKDRIRPTNKR